MASPSLEFCADSHWGPFHEGSLTDCFETTIFRCIVPVGFFLVFASFATLKIFRKSSKNSNLYQQLRPVNSLDSDTVENDAFDYQCKFWLISFTAAVYIAETCLLLSQNRPYRLFAVFLCLLSLICSAVVVKLEFKHAPIGVGRCSFVVTLFFLLLFCGNLPVMIRIFHHHNFSILNSLILLKTFLLSILIFFSLKSNLFQRSIVIYHELQSREEKASLISRLGFCWFDSLAALGT
eukprot:Sdes_comp19665_c0_seq1m11518